MVSRCSSRFQPGEGPSRGLLRDCETDGPSAALVVWWVLAITAPRPLCVPSGPGTRNECHHHRRHSSTHTWWSAWPGQTPRPPPRCSRGTCSPQPGSASPGIMGIRHSNIVKETQSFIYLSSSLSIYLSLCIKKKFVAIFYVYTTAKHTCCRTRLWLDTNICISGFCNISFPYKYK